MTNIADPATPIATPCQLKVEYIGHENSLGAKKFPKKQPASPRQIVLIQPIFSLPGISSFAAIPTPKPNPDHKSI